jgi:hypothetical protein
MGKNATPSNSYHGDRLGLLRAAAVELDVQLLGSLRRNQYSLFNDILSAALIEICQ